MEVQSQCTYILEFCFYYKYCPRATVFHIYHFNSHIKLYPLVDYILFDHSSIIGHLVNSQFFWALNILLHMTFFFFTILFLGQVPRSGITRSKYINIFYGS